MISTYRKIFETLAYADIFDYPLTADELYKLLITSKPLNFPIFKKNLQEIARHDKLIKTDGKYFFFKGRKKIIMLRQKRNFWSQKKIKIAKKVCRWLKLIPWIKMVGITGSLAMKNADKDDDIDFLIITTKNRLWLTRFLVVLLVELIGRRRRPKDINVTDKICLNMFLNESHLSLPENERDLFSAHEIVQFKPLWEKNNCYQKFLRANLWVKNYLGNSIEAKKLRYKKTKGKNLSPFLISQLLNFLEIVAYKIQIFYMKSKRTNEIVELYRIRFHPQDGRQWILKEYQKKIRGFIV